MSSLHTRKRTWTHSIKIVHERVHMHIACLLCMCVQESVSLDWVFGLSITNMVLCFLFSIMIVRSESTLFAPDATFCVTYHRLFSAMSRIIPTTIRPQTGIYLRTKLVPTSPSFNSARAWRDVAVGQVAHTHHRLPDRSLALFASDRCVGAGHSGQAG